MEGTLRDEENTPVDKNPSVLEATNKGRDIRT